MRPEINYEAKEPEKILTRLEAYTKKVEKYKYKEKEGKKHETQYDF